MRRIPQLAGVIAVMLTLGCDEQLPSDNTSPTRSFAPAQAILDGSHSGGATYFRFLPPVVAGAGTLPTANDKKLMPQLRICELANGECAADIWTFSMTKKQPADRTLSVGKNAFEAKWRTAPANLDANKTYRMRAMLDEHVIGFADIDVVNTAADLTSVDKANFVGVVKGSTVDLSFWIQAGIFSHITGRTGGYAGGHGGNVKLDVAKETTGDIHIGIIPSAVPAPGAIVVPNTYLQFMFDGQTFSKPAMLQIRLDPKTIPSSIRPQDLKVLRFAEGRWSEVAGTINELHKNQMRAPINDLAGYALGVITNQPQPVVEVTINQQQPMLGSAITGVQRIRNAAAQTACSSTLRANGTDVPQLWVGATTFPIVNGACPFEGFVARVGSGYNLHAVVDGVEGSSAPFNVSLPVGAQITVDVAPGNYYAGSAIATSAITVAVRNGAGQPLPFVDVDLAVTGGNLQLGGASVTTYAGRTDAGGGVTLPAGNWVLAPNPQTNTVRVSLPNTTLSATDDVVTASGMPHHLSANAFPAMVQQNTPLSFDVVALDEQGNPAAVNQPVTAMLNGSTPLGSVNAVNGRATFDFNFAQAASGNTITFATAGLQAHTTNSFMVWAVPGIPGNIQVTERATDQLATTGEYATIVGTNARAELRARATGAPDHNTTVAITNLAGGSVSARASGLRSNTQYELQMRVCTDQACSEFSTARTAITRPRMMTDIVASAITESSATLSWTSDPGTAALTHFGSARDGAGNTLTCEVAAAPCMLAGLTPATTYQFTVHACNADGCGQASAPVSFTTLAPPEPPSTPSFAFVSATQTSLTFNVSNVPFQGANPRVELHATAFPGGSSTVIGTAPANVGQMFTPVVLNGLFAGTMYSVSARACDDHGCSQPSQNTQQPTLQPSPMNLSIINLGPTAGTLGWSAQVIPNGAPHNFEVWLQLGSNPLQLLGSTATNSMALTLLASSSYVAQVRACNVSGCSNSQITFVTPAMPFPPAAPNRLQINGQTFNAITIAWADNSNNEDGFRIMRSNGTGFTQIASVAPGTTSYVDTDVVQGETVIYRVDAFNIAGTTSSNTSSTIVPAGQTTAVANYGTRLTQTGQNGLAAPQPPRVRVINTGNGSPLGFVTVTFTITSATSSFTSLVPRTTTATAVTNSQGIAVAPPWILQTGTSTVVATAGAFGQVTFTGIAP